MFLLPASSLSEPPGGHNIPKSVLRTILTPYGLVEIDSAFVKDYMKFKGSPLQEIVHVSVSYMKEIGKDSFHPYEELWYQSNQPIGSARKGDLDLVSNFPVGINVKLNSQFSDAEVKAAANASVRLFLDISLKRAMVSSIAVDDDCFLRFIQDLAQDHFLPYCGVLHTGIMLTVSSRSGKIEYLEFQPDS